MIEENQPPKIHLPDNLIANGAQAAMQAFSQQVQSISQLWAMASKIVAMKTPQPPIDPAVQKTYEAAMAEIQRKQAVDQMDAQRSQNEFVLKQTQQQFEQTQVMTQLRQQAVQQQQQFQQELAAFAESSRQAQEALQMQMKKNSDDFLIKLITIEQANQKLQADIEAKDREHSAKLTEMLQNSQDALQPHVSQMQDMLGQLKETKGNDTMDALLTGMHGILQHLSAPTKLDLIKDENGKTVGAVKSSVQINSNQAQ